MKGVDSGGAGTEQSRSGASTGNDIQSRLKQRLAKQGL